jgi:hypothetical protein
MWVKLHFQSLQFTDSKSSPKSGHLRGSAPSILEIFVCVSGDSDGSVDQKLVSKSVPNNIAPHIHEARNVALLQGIVLRNQYLLYSLKAQYKRSCSEAPNETGQSSSMN